MPLSQSLSYEVFWSTGHLCYFLKLGYLSIYLPFWPTQLCPVTRHVFLPTSNSNTPKQTLALCFYSDVGLLFKRELIIFCMLPVWMSPAPRSIASLSTAPLRGSSSLQAHHTQTETHLLPKLAPPPTVSGLAKNPPGFSVPRWNLISILFFRPSLQALPKVSEERVLADLGISLNLNSYGSESWWFLNISLHLSSHLQSHLLIFIWLLTILTICFEYIYQL